MAAPEQELSELHGLLAKHLKGELTKDDTPASVLSVILKFLKDNNITCEGATSPEMEALKEEVQKQAPKFDPTQVQAALSVVK